MECGGEQELVTGIVDLFTEPCNSNLYPSQSMLLMPKGGLAVALAGGIWYKAPPLG
jgi:hypothetical protein